MTKRQKTKTEKREFNIVTSGQFRTLAMFYDGNTSIAVFHDYMSQQQQSIWYLSQSYLALQKQPFHIEVLRLKFNHCLRLINFSCANQLTLKIQCYKTMQQQQLQRLLQHLLDEGVSDFTESSGGGCTPYLEKDL